MVIPDAWSVLYPRRQGDWTMADSAGAWGRFVPETRCWHRVDPVNDRALPALARAVTVGQLRGYRVERRAVIDAGESFIKVVRPKRLDRVIANHEALAGQCADVVFPAVLDTDADGAVRIDTIAGDALHDLLRSDALDVDVIGRVAAALAAFHRLAPPRGLAPRRVDERDHWLGIVSRVEPETAQRLSSVADALPELSSAENVLVHGDLHDKNLMIADHSVGIIDLDGLALGAPEDDLANLCVHLDLRAMQAGNGQQRAPSAAKRLRQAYGVIHPIDTHRFHAIECHTWFRLTCLYRYRRGSRRLCDEMLRRAAASG